LVTQKRQQFVRPTKRLPFKRFASANPLYLTVEGVEALQVVWRTPTFGTRLDFDSTFKDITGMMQYCGSGFSPSETITTFCGTLWKAGMPTAAARRTGLPIFGISLSPYQVDKNIMTVYSHLCRGQPLD
jgi:hypothetical protein